MTRTGRPSIADNAVQGLCGLNCSGARNTFLPEQHPTRKSCLARADGHTLFLDEIGDISTPLQRQLIKAFEEHVYSPPGFTEVLKSRFRQITATNRDMDESRSRLDPDFLDRISMLPIEIPPLKDIPEDILWLWGQVLQEAMRRAGPTVGNARMVTAGRTSLPVLRRESLPGDMRDLFVSAYRTTAAMGEASDPMPPDKAVEYPMAGLAHPTVHCGDAMEKVLRRFLDQ